MTPNDALLTTREVADVLSVDPETVRRWIRDGKLKAVELPSGTLRIRQSAVDRILRTIP